MSFYKRVANYTDKIKKLADYCSQSMKKLQSSRVFLNSASVSLVSKNIVLKDKGRGKRAFLFATGPSIKNEDLSVLVGEDCFSVSNFFLHDKINYIAPKIHFFAPYHKPLILENYVEWLKLADQKLPKATNIMLGHATYDLVQTYGLFKNREIFYLYLDAFNEYEYDVDITKRVLRPQTGPLMILPVLVYMQYKEIYLIGCDHTVLRDYKNKIPHFYGSNQDIRCNASDKNTWTNIVYELECMQKTFLQYEFYKRIADVKGICVCNLSQDSWLECFENKKLDQIFCESNKNNLQG